MKEDFEIRMKKHHLGLFAIIVIFFLLGFGVNILREKLTAIHQSQINTCKSFCDSLSNTAYSHVQIQDGQAHCYCAQDMVVYNLMQNKTINWKQVVDAGVVKDLNISGIDPLTRQQLIRQQLAAQTGG